MRDFSAVETLLLGKTSSKYERSSYDKFLKKVGFSYGIPSIHITGTNGKGSTAEFLYQIYRKSGLKVGVYQSPFFQHPTEMVKIDGSILSEASFMEVYSRYEKQFEEYDLTAFEIETFIAFESFKEAGCDLTVIEVGMGGVTDATNVINPLLSIVTSISLEHTQYLGRTYSEIAYNKAGIIKEKSRVLTGKLEETAQETIRIEAEEKESSYRVVDDFYSPSVNEKGTTFDYLPFHGLSAPVLSSALVKDACLAIQAAQILNDVLPVSESNIREGLKAYSLEGRTQFFGNVLVDGAHNAEAVELLCNDLPQITGGRTVHVLFASFRDKNIAVELPLLANVSSDITLTTFDHPRARGELDYFLYEGDHRFVEDWKSALIELKETYPQDVILVVGSLAFAGEAIAFLKEKK